MQWRLLTLTVGVTNRHCDSYTLFEVGMQLLANRSGTIATKAKMIGSVLKKAQYGRVRKKESLEAEMNATDSQSIRRRCSVMFDQWKTSPD